MPRERFLLVVLTTVALLLTSTCVRANEASSIRVDIHGAPFPASLSLDGSAVSPTSLRPACSKAERRLLQPLVEEIGSIVSRERDGRRWVRFTDQTTVVDTGTNIQLQPLHLDNDSYVVRIDTSRTSIALPILIPAFYDCLTISVGTSKRAQSLGLYVPDFNVATPTYSPALGFYVTTET